MFKNEKRFLDEIKNIFIVFEGLPFIEKIKNSRHKLSFGEKIKKIKTSRHKLLKIASY